MKTLLTTTVRRLLLLGAVFSLTSCGLFIEGIVIGVNRARMVPAGKVLKGDGFVLHSPEKDLIPSHNEPTRGGITLRSEIGYLSFVTPFKTSTAKTTDQALAEWNRRPGLHGRQVVVRSQAHTTFAGLPATRAILHFPHSYQRHDAVMLMIKRSDDFLVVAASWPDHMRLRDKQMEELQRNVSISRR